MSGTGPSRVSLYPLVHTFVAQRFQKGGMQLFLQDSPNETFGPAGWTGNPTYLLDPTVVPGDGVKGCVALTVRRPGGSAMGQRAATVEGAIQQGWAHLIWIGCEVRTYGLILRTHFKQQYALLAACGQGVRDMHC